MRKTYGIVDRQVSASLFFLLGVLFFSACGSGRSGDQVKNDPGRPFEVSDAYVREWLGGAPGSGKGHEFVLQLASRDNGIVLDSVYYNKMAGALDVSRVDSTLLRAQLKPIPPAGFTMEVNPENEAVNTPLDRIKTASDTTQAVLIYTHDGMRKFTLISAVRKSETVAYPSGPPQDRQ